MTGSMTSNMADFSHLPYREGVGVMLLNQANEVFVGKRIDMRSEHWQMPQGGIDPGESPREAVMRELEEETGTAKATIIRETIDWLYYDLPADLVPKVWGGKYRGQKQKWFLLRFTGEDADINIHTDHPEFSEWQWIPVVQLPELIVPFKRELYEQAIAALMQS